MMSIFIAIIIGGLFGFIFTDVVDMIERRAKEKIK